MKIWIVTHSQLLGNIKKYYAVGTYEQDVYISAGPSVFRGNLNIERLRNEQTRIILVLVLLTNARDW